MKTRKDRENRTRSIIAGIIVLILVTVAIVFGAVMNAALDNIKQAAYDEHKRVLLESPNKIY